ncbi:hypothetical protein PVAG01_06287 [Phlyctema vagabunda]|uniref:2EXR domain-containing protein n=1 Tax=Phlyctema vagabunda TaxID=108571 RepID=A0ABR4PFL8_9HELO
MNSLRWVINSISEPYGLLDDTPAALNRRPGMKNFHMFMDLPFELRSMIWRFSYPNPRILSLGRSEEYTFNSVFNATKFPPILLALMHVNHEAREEIRRVYCILNTSMLDTVTPRLQVPCPPTDLMNTSIWLSRGSICLNVYEDYLFFDKFIRMRLSRGRVQSLAPSMVMILLRPRHLALSMNVWKKCRRQWLRIFRSMRALKDLVFVLEGRSTPFQVPQPVLCDLKFIERYEVGLVDESDLSALWMLRIQEDINREKLAFPEWVVPTISFQGIARNFRDLSPFMCV